MKIETKIDNASGSTPLIGSQIFKTKGIYKPIAHDGYIVVINEDTVLYCDEEENWFFAVTNKGCWKDEKFVVANVKINVTFDNIIYAN